MSLPLRRVRTAATAAALTAGALTTGAFATAANASGPPPGNDARADATPLPSLPAELTVNNNNATTEMGDIWRSTVWYSLTAPVSGTVGVAADSNFKETLQVWSGGVLVNADRQHLGNHAELTFAASVGQTYLIGFGSRGTATGTGLLAVVESPNQPDAPTATADNASAEVSWTAPDSNGPGITGYTVRAYDGSTLATSKTVTGGPPATSTTVTGLTNGVAYTFTVTATNGLGTSPESSASDSVTPVTVPGQPTGVTTTDGHYEETVSWTAPADDGGTPITGYTVTVWDGGTVVDTVPVTGNPPDTSTTVTGLTNGTTYSFYVTATNAVGEGGSSGSQVGTPVVPVVSAPQSVTAVAGEASAEVSWSPPLTLDGADITSWTVTASPGGATTTADGNALSVDVPNLTDFTSYTFTVTANFIDGQSAVSDASAAVGPTPLQGRYQDLGGASGSLGVAVSPELPIGSGTGQQFVHGLLLWSPATGVVLVHGDIEGRYLALGGPTGPLGFPTADETATTGVDGRQQTFQHSTIYWTAATGAHEVHGAIAVRYAALGGPAGLLGFPISDEVAAAGSAGRANVFAHGTIFWSQATGAHEVHGSILAHYLQLGGPAGLLGFPITDENVTPGGAGRYNHFRYGSIYWSPATGAHEVHGAIRLAWAARGWEQGPLGFPTSDEIATGPLRRNDFVHGSITYDTRTARVTVVIR